MISFTADLGEMVIPSIVGVDIGCGMLTVEPGDLDISFENLDRVIRDHVPGGMNVHDEAVADFPEFEQTRCYDKMAKRSWIQRSLGTRGGIIGSFFKENGKDFGYMNEERVICIMNSARGKTKSL